MSPPVGLGGRILGPETVFNPLSLSPFIWVRGDSYTLSMSTGKINRLVDLSGNANDFIQNFSAGQPVPGTTINGKPTFDFTNGQSSSYSPIYMGNAGTTTTTAARTVYVALKFVGSQAGDARILETDYATDYFLGVEDAAGKVTLIVNENSSGAPRLNAGTDTAGNTYLAFTIDGSTTEVLYQNGLQIGTRTNIVSPTPGTKLRAIGNIGGFGAIFMLAEYFEWNRKLSGSEQTSMNSYMHSRYGI